MQRISIIIPAHNEENRIGKTITSYHAYLKEHKISFEFIVVLNGCTDDTYQVVHEKQQQLNNMIIIDLPQAGKGLAIQAGFADALTRNNDLIGFVDADMATQPQYFYELATHIGEYDGIIASRYMPDSKLYPPRPAIKRWGSKIVYESLIWLLFGMNYYDYQCGAKLFKRRVIQEILPYLTIDHWAFDVELLYMCQLFGFTIKEYPTVWHDQVDSKLKISSGFRMLGSLIKARWHHSSFYKKDT